MFYQLEKLWFVGCFQHFTLICHGTTLLNSEECASLEEREREREREIDTQLTEFVRILLRLR